MQNFQDGDTNAKLDGKWHPTNSNNAVAYKKNLIDSFKDDENAHKIKVQAQADQNVKYRLDLKNQCEDNYKRSQFEYEDSREEMSKLKDATYYMSLQDQSALKREKKIQERDELNDKMCSEMVANEMDRQYYENTINAKHDDEDREKIRIEDQITQERRAENMRELRDGLLTQIEENKQTVLDEKAKQLHYRDQSNAVMEMEDEREKERARKKKEADDQYFADLRQQIADNAMRRKKEKEDNAL